MKTISVLFPYNSGDLIASLPGFQKIYRETGLKARIYQQIGLPASYYEGAEHPIKNKSGQQVCMNMPTFRMMRKLLENQEYIEQYNTWRGEKCDFDFVDTRDRKRVPMPYGDIHFWPFMVMPDLSCDLSVPWIDVDIAEQKWQKYKNYIIVNRTSRYNNPYIHYFFLKKYENQIIFVGVKEEHEKFCADWGVDVHHEVVQDFLEIACILKAAKGFLGNQSFCWHLADAMKLRRILEYSPHFPNTHPKGANGQIAVYQESLELYFNQMCNNE